MFTFSNAVNASFEDTVLATKDALKRHGFEVLAEIDMRRAFKRHLALDFPPYLILSACNPTLAHRAVHQIHDGIGSVLFCNIVVQQQNDGHVNISAADPADFMYVTNHVELDWVIREIRSHLQTAIEEIEAEPARRSYLPEREKVTVVRPVIKRCREPVMQGSYNAGHREPSRQDRSVRL